MSPIVHRERPPRPLSRVTGQLAEHLAGEAVAILALVDGPAAGHAAEREIRDRLRGALRGVAELERAAPRMSGGTPEIDAVIRVSRAHDAVRAWLRRNGPIREARARARVGGAR